MKKIIFIAIALFSLIFASSCNREEQAVPEGKHKLTSITASLDGSTKTSLQSSGIVNWSENDCIAVISGSNVYIYTLQEGAGTPIGRFIPVETAATYTDPAELTAVYPAIAVKDASTIAINRMLTSQEALATNRVLSWTEDSSPFAFTNNDIKVSKPAFSTETSDGLNFKFTQLGTWCTFKFDFTQGTENYGGELIRTVSIKTSDNKGISGSATLSGASIGAGSETTITRDYSNSNVSLANINNISFMMYPVVTTSSTLEITMETEYHTFKFYGAPTQNFAGGTTLSFPVTVDKNFIKNSGVLYYTVTDKSVPTFYYYGTANCLLLANNATSGTLNVAPYKTDYTFKYTGTDATGETPSATKAEVIWEESAGFITSATISGTTMTVNKQSGVYGNAVVGIYDASDNLLWSYHIWAPEDNPTTLAYTKTNSRQTYNVMNMPIGATKALTAASSNEDKVKGYGLFYQWGRKDPLGRANAIASNTIKPVYDKNGSTITFTSATYLKDINDVLAGYTDEATDGPMSHFMARYAIANPAVFITVPSGQYSNNWAGETNNHLWGNSYPSGTYPKMNQTYKSIFDPSPAGYRVAPPDTWVNFTITKANSSTVAQFNAVGNEGFNWTATNFTTIKGYEFYYQSLGTGPSHFYGASGNINGASGALRIVGTYGYSWSSGTNGVGALNLYFNASNVYPLNSNNRAFGWPVRCVKE